MNISYNIEKLKRIIDDLCTVTGLAMAVIDTKHNYIYKRDAEESEFCSLIQSTPEGRSGCLFCDSEMMAHSAKSKLPYSHVCHGGLFDTSVPILKNGIVAGYIVIGRVRKGDFPDAEAIERITSYGIPKDKLLSAFPRVTHLSDSQLDSLIRLISHILFENAIDIDYGEFINRATEYIDLNLDTPLSVKQICTDLYVSKNYLYESFEDYFKKTVNEYITDRRIALAKIYLSHPETPVTEVAEAVGIYNYTYFSKLFKKKVGMTPSEYKKLPHGK